LNLSQFCELPSTISEEQALQLNLDLSTKSLKDIPVEIRADLEKYLAGQLMLNAVKSELISSLDALLQDLQTA
jgi:hypothetical protein